MTTIRLYAGVEAEIGDEILLGSWSETRHYAPYPRHVAISKAKEIIARRGLTDVLVMRGREELWADGIATARLYPESGPTPKPYRSDRDGGMRYQPVIASSAVRCPWDPSRFRVIEFAS